MTRAASVCLAALLTIGSTAPHASDWPEFRGEGRRGVWTETGILEKFPEGGLTVRWRTPINLGYSGPAVADGRVFVTDFSFTTGLRGIERALCLDEETGRILWTREWEVHYAGMSFPNGPRATPTIDDDRVYVLGGAGLLQAFDVETGRLLWKTDYMADYQAEMPVYGISSAPIVHDDRLIALVGGTEDALVVAFDKMTGEEVWRALPSLSEPGVSAPIIITAGGTQQLIVWHPQAVVSLDPVTGKVYWEQPFRAGVMNPAVPVQSGSQLLVSTFFIGSLLLSLDDDKPAAKVLWQGKSSSEIKTDGLHSVLATPVIQDGHIYGLCSYGQLRCLLAETGDRVWETQDVLRERARWASGFFVQNGDRVFINNDRGELIIARFTPGGYQEISRTQLIKPTTPPGNRRELKFVNASHPAYANRHIYARNDEEIISASLAAGDSR